MTFKVLKHKIIITLGKDFWKGEEYGANLHNLINYLEKDNINKVHIFFHISLTHDWILRTFVEEVLRTCGYTNIRIIVHCKRYQYHHIIDRLRFPEVKVVSDAGSDVCFGINNTSNLKVTVTNIAVMQRLSKESYCYTEGE